MSVSQKQFMPNIQDDHIPRFILGEMSFHKQANALDITTKNMKHRRLRVRKVEPDEFFQNMNSQQREILSRDILNGKSKQLSSYQRSGNNPTGMTEASLMSSMDRDVAKSMIHMSRHKFASTPFLRLDTSRARIEKGSPSAKLKLQVEKCRRLVKDNVRPSVNYLRDEFMAFDDELIQSVEPSVLSSPKGRLVQRSHSSAKIATAQCSSIAAAISSYKSRMLKDRVAKIKDDRENNTSDRMSNTIAAQRRKGLMKKVSDFRRLVYKRLDETKNPHMATILRLLDSGVINNFIDKFKGTTMSVDAVIYNLIGTVPTTELESESLADMPRIMTPSLTAVRPLSSSGQAVTGSRGNDSSSGNRPKTPLSPNTDTNANANANIDTNMGKAVVATVDKKSLIETAAPSIKQTKSTFCGGFRSHRPTSPVQTLPRPDSRSKERQDFSYRPKSPLRFETNKDQTLVLNSKNFTLLSPATKSIISLHSQLVIEDTLPSVQPEEVLTQEQITRIGSAKDGYRQVEREIISKKQGDLRKHLASGGTKEDFERAISPGKRVSPPAGLRAPKSIKTFDFEIDTPTGRADLVFTPKSPFLNGDEQGRVMSTGMTGNRFPLMNLRQTKRRGLKLDQVDRYGNPIDPEEIKAREDEKLAAEEAMDENLLKYMESMTKKQNEDKRVSTF